MDYWTNGALQALALNHLANRIEATGSMVIPSGPDILLASASESLTSRTRYFVDRLRRLAENALG
jgi:hypothetical protein